MSITPDMEDRVRELFREEILKTLQILSDQAEPTPYETGDFERIVLGVLAKVADKTSYEVKESDNGQYPQCDECGARPGAVKSEHHEEWCSNG